MILINESTFNGSTGKGNFGKASTRKYSWQKYECMYIYKGHNMYHTKTGVTEGKTGLQVYAFINSKDPKFPYRKNTYKSFKDTAKWLEYIFSIENIDYSVNNAIKQIGEIPDDYTNYFI